MTDLSFATPSMKEMTHGRTLTSSLTTRKGTFATSTLMNFVRRCFAAKVYPQKLISHTDLRTKQRKSTYGKMLIHKLTPPEVWMVEVHDRPLGFAVTVGIRVQKVVVAILYML